jgi:hypothetical protein
MKITQTLINQISSRFNGAVVADIAVDSEYGNVTATVSGVKFVDCGFVEDYE